MGLKSRSQKERRRVRRTNTSWCILTVMTGKCSSPTSRTWAIFSDELEFQRFKKIDHQIKNFRASNKNMDVHTRGTIGKSESRNCLRSITYLNVTLSWIILSLRSRSSAIVMAAIFLAHPHRDVIEVFPINTPNLISIPNRHVRNVVSRNR